MAPTTPDEMLEFLVVANTGSGPYPHPVEVALHPDGVDSRMSFSLGAHVANVGGQLPLSEVLDDEWTGLDPGFQLEFDAGDLHWLVPYLVRLMAGEDVTYDIVSAYVARHGRQPKVLRQRRYGA